MKGLGITSWVVVIMVFVTVAYTILVSVANIGAQVGAEYWRRSGYYVASRTADSLTNLAYSDVDELLVTMNLKDVDTCSIVIIADESKLGGMAYATVKYKGKETSSASRFMFPNNIDVSGIDRKAPLDCKKYYLRFRKEENKLSIKGEDW